MQNQQLRVASFRADLNHRVARIAVSARPQPDVRPITISVISSTSDRCSLALPAASRQQTERIMEVDGNRPS
jgi:hypothetical protein